MSITSVETTKGRFQQPLISDKTQNSDPWKRSYYQPPGLKPFVPRTYPIIDIGPELAKPGSTPTELLKKYGFGVVKHQSRFVEELGRITVKDENYIEIYHREVQELAKQTLGVKTAFITTSVFRLGEGAPTEMKLPLGLRSAAVNTPDLLREDTGAKAGETLKSHDLTGQTNLTRSTPIRIPHIDLTPLGARQAIRHQAQDIYDEAVKSGIIAYEDEICKGQLFEASTKEASSLIEQEYNARGKLGPRYASYSIWRSLCKVLRDPISLSPYDGTTANGSVYWPYENKVPGPKELGGDYLKEYAMLGVRGEKPVAEDDGRVPKFYYLSEQQPDEVFFIKLFDSASLGPEAEHAGASFHGSPEIGNVEDDPPRESIEVRAMVFW